MEFDKNRNSGPLTFNFSSPIFQKISSRVDFTATLDQVKQELARKFVGVQSILVLFKEYDQKKIQNLQDFILNEVLHDPKKYYNIAVIWLYCKAVQDAKRVNLTTNEFEHKVWQELFWPMLPDLARSVRDNLFYSFGTTWKEPLSEIITDLINQKIQCYHCAVNDLSREANLFLVTVLIVYDLQSNLTLWKNFWKQFGRSLYEYDKMDPVTWRVVWKTLPGYDLFQAPFEQLPFESFGEYAPKLLNCFEIDWLRSDTLEITATLVNEKINLQKLHLGLNVSTWVSSLFQLTDFIHGKLANPHNIPKVDICQTLMRHTILQAIREDLVINIDDMTVEHNAMLQHVVVQCLDNLKPDERARGLELLEKMRKLNGQLPKPNPKERKVGESKLPELIQRNDWEELAQFLKENHEYLTEQMYPNNANLSTKSFADKLAIHTIQPLVDHALHEGAKLEASVEQKKNAIQSLTLQREELLRQAAALEAQVVTINAELKVESEELAMTKRKQDTLDQNLKFFRSALAKHEPALTKWQQKMQSDLSDWNLDDVLIFLTEIGLDKYTTVFTENKIDGAVLEQLETNDLMTVLKVPFKDTKKILMYVYLVQTHHDVYTIPPGVLQWNNDTVCTWLEDNKFGHLVDIFKKNEVVGAELAFLEKSDLMNHYKILALGDVMKLQKEISKLKDSMKDERFLQAQMQNNNNNADFVQVQHQLEEMKRFNDELKIALKEKNTKIPEAFICPITQDMMQDPVVASDGHTYERTAIELWLKNKNSSPMTGLQLANKQLTPSHTLKSMIREFVDLAKKK